MTRTEERLTDALTAAADAIGAGTLRPLIAPAPRRRPGWLAWAGPIAAAASVLLVVGLAVAGQLSGRGQGTVPATGSVPRYFVSFRASAEELVVRSVATGAVTATALYAPRGNKKHGVPVVASAGHGTFYAAIYRGASVAERIYQFQVTGNGQISGLAPVPGGTLAHGMAIEAMAASPDGSRVAVGVTNTNAYKGSQIIVIAAATGGKTVWNGGTSHPGQFTVASLSWTASGGELAVLGQWCQQYALGNEECFSQSGTASRTAELWALNPDSGGGQLTSGRLLLQQSARNPFIAQAIISRDGSVITAAVLTPWGHGPGPGRPVRPGRLVVRQISVATGQQLRVLYRHQLPRTDTGPSSYNFIALSSDSSGRHWLVSDLAGLGAPKGPAGSINGWIRAQQVVPLPPAWGNVNSEAW